MDDQRRFRRQKDDDTPPSEGVRIIGPDEAAEAMERPDVASRRGQGDPRPGDRPAGPPEGPRPTLRFPLDSTADPSRIERPPVEPAPDPVTGPVELPHWTEPPTGEVPAVLVGDDIDSGGEDDDEAWSSFATSAPRWRDADDDWGDDDFMTNLAERSGEIRVGALADDDDRPAPDDYYGFDDLDERVEERTADTVDQPRWADEDDSWAASSSGERDDDGWGDDDYADDYDDEGRAAAELGDEPTEAVDVTEIDDEPYDYDADDDEDDDVLTTGEREIIEAEYAEEDDDDLYDDGYDDERGGSGGGLASKFGPVRGNTGERNMATAVGVGLALAGVALVAMAISPALMVIVVTAALGFAAFEYFNVLHSAEWESVPLLGVAACVAMPLAVYWRGPAYYPMLLFIVFAAILGWYLVGAGGREPRVLEGSASTLFGVIWIGGFGSSAAGMLALDKGRPLPIAAILATVAYDVVGLFVGKFMGQRPLNAASPNKTVEGLMGGMAAALVVTIITVGIAKFGPWNGFSAALILGIGAACAAPLGDLSQSLLKRDLDIKDMGSILPGHGGLLDRFDSMLFVLPTVFWLTVAVGLS